MSIRLTAADANDQLAAAITTLTIGAGDFSVGVWVYLVSTNGTTRKQILWIDDGAVGDAMGLMLSTTALTVDMYHGSADFTTATSALSTGTWYYMVMSRTGTTHQVRIFDDSTSTTPVTSGSRVTSWSPTTLDRALVGWASGTWDCADAELVSLKIYTGAEWTNAECRTESQSYSIVKSGGTDRLCWKLTDIDADTDGIYEIGGGGPNFTNSGVSAGASAPTQLASGGTTLYFLDSVASGSNFGQLQVGGSAPSTATTATGWTVDTVGATNYALMAYASERASTVFSGTAQPAGNPDNSLGDCFRSTSTMSGDFATGVWTIAVPVIAVSAAAGQDGRVRVRLWKSSNATGTSPTEITSGAVAGTTVTNLTTGAEQVSTVTTGSITGFSMTNEYLFVQIAWEITGAAT